MNRVALPLAAGASLVEQVLLRPTFHQHYDAVVLDWRYVEAREVATLAEEGRWAFRQSLQITFERATCQNKF